MLPKGVDEFKLILSSLSTDFGVSYLIYGLLRNLSRFVKTQQEKGEPMEKKDKKISGKLSQACQSF